MALKPSNRALNYSRVMVIPASEFAVCGKCGDDFLPNISLHPRICCIKKRPDYSTAAANFYTRDRRIDIENFPGYWLDIAISTTNRIEIYSRSGRESHVLVEFSEDVSFDKLCEVTRAKARVVDAICKKEN